jgi:hypothetical protein
MFSLVGLAVLAVGRAAATDGPASNPPSLYPLYNAPAQADLRQQPSLVPVMKPATPAAGPTYYYQKDAAANSGTITVTYQEPGRPQEQGKVAQPTPEVSTLPKSATNTEAPRIGEIPFNNEASLRRAIIDEVREYHQSDIFSQFPEKYDPLTKLPYAPRSFRPSVQSVEPMFVCYERLYYEDKNTERYGWEFGVLQPLVSVGKFYADVLMFPYHFGTRPCQRFEADAGYCLPGDPVPYLIYPVELSLSGGLLEAGTAVGLAAIFP